MGRMILAIGLMIFGSGISYAQVSGNQVYGDKNQNLRNNGSINTGRESVTLEGDSVLYINASVLLNTPADYYLAVFGVNQFAKTVKDANAQTNKRIDKFLGSLQSLGIHKKDVFVDFITQTKIYDYSLSNNVATQTQTGFQTRKNVIVKFQSQGMLDNLVANAAESEIYDLIKVDYVMDDYMKIHKQMVSTATEIINEKKNIYLQSSAFELLPASVISRDNFYPVFPATQYEKYEAYESGNVNAYYDSKLVKKDMLTDNSFYYEGSDAAAFDKVVNPGVTYVGIQFVLNFKMKYYIKKNKIN